MGHALILSRRRLCADNINPGKKHRSFACERLVSGVWGIFATLRRISAYRPCEGQAYRRPVEEKNANPYAIEIAM